MKARFKGEEAGGDRVCDVFGQTFFEGQWTEVESDLARQKLPGNPMFDTDADEDGETDPALDDIRAQLTELGVAWSPRAGLETLSKRLAEAKAAKADGETDPA